MGGIIFTAALGGTFLTLAMLEKKTAINQDAVRIVMETAKFGMLGYLLFVAFKAFL